jgi:hypothetical protein
MADKELWSESLHNAAVFAGVFMIVSSAAYLGAFTKDARR